MAVGEYLNVIMTTRLRVVIICCMAGGLRDISVGNGLCAVPQYRVSGFLTGSANTEIVDFDPLWAKIHGNGTQAVPYKYALIF